MFPNSQEIHYIYKKQQTNKNKQTNKQTKTTKKQKQKTKQNRKQTHNKKKHVQFKSNFKLYAFRSTTM